MYETPSYQEVTPTGAQPRGLLLPVVVEFAAAFLVAAVVYAGVAWVSGSFWVSK